MTIGFLINTCEPFYRGGYERRVWAFARELAREGHDVRIYTSCPRDEIIDGVRFVRLGAFRPFFNRRGVRNGWADLLFALNILRLLGKLRAGELEVLDVCATPFLHLPLVALVARLKRIPLAVTCHEALLDSLPEYVRERGHRDGPPAKLLLLFLRGLYRLGMGSIPRRIAVSQRTAAALAREHFPAAATIEFGLEPEVFHPQAPEARPPSSAVPLVFCGRLTPVKAVDQSIAALLELRLEAKHFHFDIIGVGSEQARLEEMVAAAGAEPWFTFHGEVSEEQKRLLFAASDVFLLSSPREGFSVATLEAMAQGCAALVINDPQRPNGALDFVHPNEQGLCVAPGPEALRDGLRRLLGDAELRLRLRQGAWIMAQRYRIENQARMLWKFYGEMTGSA
jgi:glycosyltransferase involved in cell wall biosynthesis